MSLLLDALKKAASEKEKLKSSDGVDQPSPALNKNDEHDVEESEELNLDLDVPEENDVYPEIDEKVEIPEEQEEEKSSQIIIESIEPEEELTYEKDEAEEAKESEDIEESNNQIEIVEKEKPEEAEKIDLVKEVPTKKPDRVENKEALSELINKSNHSSRRKKVQTKIIIASSLALVFLVTAGYLYLEYSVGSQNIYIKNAEINPVKRLERREAVLDSSKNPTVSSKKPAKKIVSKIKTSQKKQSTIKAPKPEAVKKRAIKIAHKTVKNPIGVLVRQAYDAFNQQDYKTSEQLYRQVIREESKNRDALLGLAAIAVKQKRYEYARQKYSQLRYLNPKDSLAIAGLSSMQNKINSAMSESELKFILREQPEAAHLYFALGSIYADQKKWADAQASFFSAWSAENTNADYAFNLAVSLDQMGKKTQAKQLYELSLKLNKTQKWNFSNQTVENRIRALNENSH